MLVGLKSRAAVFSVQRDVTDFRGEPLMAILPGVVLDELWDVVGGTERALQVMTGFVVLASLAGLVAAVLAGLEQRRRELAILRAVGAGPRHMLELLCAEGALITVAGVVLGLLAHWAGVLLLADWVRTRWGISLARVPLGANELLLLGAIVACGLLASLIPGWRAYRLSLADGLSPKV
jgi:putative ABC transport system permease protein